MSTENLIKLVQFFHLKVIALCRGLAKFRPAFRGFRGWTALSALSRRNTADIRVLN